MNRRDVLIGMAAAVSLLMAAGTAANRPPSVEGNVYRLADKREPFERPDFLAPKHLSACERLHLGGPWSTENLTAAERDAALTQLRAEFTRVRKACASGRGDRLL